MYGFIHPPKSGGSKFKHMFKDEPQVCYPLRAYGHATLDTWTQAFTAKVVDKFPCDKIITIKRNPFERVVSLYFHYKRDPQSKGIWSYAKKYDFSTFAAHKLSVRQLPPVWWYVRDADIVLDFDNYQHSLNILCDILDIPRKELGPKPNNYEQPWLAHYKTQAAIDKIAALYKEDVENLAYQVPTLITS